MTTQQREAFESEARRLGLEPTPRLRLFWQAAQQVQGEPVAWVHEKVFALGRDQFHGYTKPPRGLIGMVPLYAQPQTAQQVQQESEPSLVSDNRSLADIGNELHNLAVALHYNGREGDSDEIREIALELWEWEKSRPQPAQQVPEPTMEDAIGVLAADMDTFGQDDAEMMLESLRAYHVILKNKLETPEPAQQADNFAERFAAAVKKAEENGYGQDGPQDDSWIDDLGRTLEAYQGAKAKGKLGSQPVQQVPGGWSTMGVGDGSGQLFVHGPHDAIKACQRLLILGEKARQVSEGYTAVKTETVEWLLGYRGDFKCPESDYFRGKPAPFFWRRKLRAALLTPAQEKSHE